MGTVNATSSQPGEGAPAGAVPGETPFPATLQEITSDWLTRTLRDAGIIGSAQITAVEVTPLGVGHGFASTLARLHLTYADGEGPASIVAKTVTPDAKSRELFARFGLYQREVRFYREIAPAGGVDSPACYFAAIDDASDEFLLLLEDLALDAGRFGDQVTGASDEETRAVFEALARFHALWWHAEERTELGWLVRPPEQLQRFALEYAEGLPAFRAECGERFPELVRIAELLDKVLADVLDEPVRPPLTISHGDLRLDNVFFRDDGGIRLIDWQLAALDRAGVDVARFVAESLPIDVRRTHQDDLLRAYHAELTRHGVTDFSLRRLRNDYREGMIIQLGLSVVAMANLGFDNERGEELSEAMLARLEAALVDLQVPRLLRTGRWFFRVRRVLRSAKATALSVARRLRRGSR